MFFVATTTAVCCHLCPLAVLYVFGLYISAGVSLWRLLVLEHDLGNANGGANLKPALKVLYCLAAAQGFLFVYKTIYSFTATIGLSKFVADLCSVDKYLVSDYLEYTVAWCEKDPSFATGRNLVTYAMGLVTEAKLDDRGFIAGVRILGRVVYGCETRLVAVRHLLTRSASFSHVVRALLEALGPRSSYSVELRVHAAKIVAHVACSIHLEDRTFPGEMVIQGISSLLDTFEEHTWRPDGYDVLRNSSRMPKEYARGWFLDEYERRPLVDHKRLVVQGLRILRNLAADEGNCRVIVSSKEGLLSKALAPLISCSLLHGDDDHDGWSFIASVSTELLWRLTSAPGAVGSMASSEVSRHDQEILAALRSIIECRKCSVLLKRQAVQTLLLLSADTSSITSGGGRSGTIFTWTLLSIFLLPDYCFDVMSVCVHKAKKSSCIGKLAGEKLKAMVPSVGDVFGSLAGALIDGSQDITYRLDAASILESLCRCYTKDDEYLKEMQNAISKVMPEVLQEMAGDCRPKNEEKIASAEESNVKDSIQGSDLEKGDGVSQHKVQENGSSSEQQNGDVQEEGNKLREALISLCREILRNWDHRQFNEIAAKTCSEQGIPAKMFRSLVADADDLLEKEKKARKLAKALVSSPS
ncbi:hypothetical protein HU200_052878 [Digitaria exilis]|uniref:Uncharacterized protein n=1 Tax=Digitaria exilis TaxID=1010633 RepID=A0A835E411_9POAL|nr:hypothetical protein HU200_052878 [Digitaria exilis]